MKRPFKKLDDVIKAMDFCINDGDAPNCLGCPYADEDGEAACCGNDREDALHYLKEYRQTRKDLLDGMRRLEEKEMMFIHAMADTENNHPLSWEELKSMKGKPVWVELNSEYDNFSHWGIIRNFLKIGCEFEYMELSGYYDLASFSVGKDKQGKEWQAYRKERKNETD